MRSSAEKYKEAVERNLFGAAKYRINKYSGLSVTDAKIKLGIRKDDSMYDEQVLKLVTTPKKDTQK